MKLDKSQYNMNHEYIFSSQQFLSLKGYIKAYNYIKASTRMKIVIIGDSYQAFQSALLLIYGPKIYDTKEETENKSSAFISKRIKPCDICNSTPIDDCKSEAKSMISGKNMSMNQLSMLSEKFNNDIRNRNHHPLGNLLKNTPDNVKSMNKKISARTESILERLKENTQLPYCICCGNIVKENFAEIYQYLSPLNFKDNEITILHIGEIKIYYKNSEEAKNANYIEYTKHDINNVEEIHSINGLRGLCKTLYENVT